MDPVSGYRSHFGDHIPVEFVELWKRSGKRQVISQAELFPVLVAKMVWSCMIEGRSVLWFLDNESSRMALVRNYSPVLDNFYLLQVNAKLDMSNCSRNWYARVPSASNPSDAASRLEFSAYEGSVFTEIDYSYLLEQLVNFRQLICQVEKER